MVFLTAKISPAVVAVTLLLAVTDAAPREKRQVNNQYPQYQQPQQQQQQFVQNNAFQCPQPDGQFAYTPDCYKFYQCDGGVATITDCQPQLVFNDQRGYCDWPANVPTCPRRNSLQILKQEMNGLCDSNPAGGDPRNTFLVRHPRYCNAFYTCATGYLFGQCSFCPEGAYFNRLAGGCRAIPAGTNESQVCEGTQYVHHTRKIEYVLDAGCWPFANLANPWQALADTIRRTGQNLYNQYTNNNAQPVYNNPNTYPNTNTNSNPNAYPNTYPNTNTNYQG
ncbi:chitin binding peritrophin-a [Plakobranchus ocellatus]|uniref:Chitin binding peritrophin-a n=1 Tax=Plakobranchus ocellatus TaxID=259542 RepID=A0AAV3XV99_9GAST|nr:chitin binding peritrophin-a [Plakobranchus ocellatus]